MWPGDGTHHLLVEAAVCVGKPTDICMQRVIVFLGLWTHLAQNGVFSPFFLQKSPRHLSGTAWGNGPVQV